MTVPAGAKPGDKITYKVPPETRTAMTLTERHFVEEFGVGVALYFKYGDLS